MAGPTRLELATSGVTGRRSNQAELRSRSNRKDTEFKSAWAACQYGAHAFLVPSAALLAVPLLALFFQLFQGAAHQLTFEGREAVDEELAVEVVDLVLQGAGEKTLGFDGERLPVGPECFDRYALEALDVAVEAGKAEAAFLADL